MHNLQDVCPKEVILHSAKLLRIVFPLVVVSPGRLSTVSTLFAAGSALFLLFFICIRSKISSYLDIY